MYKKIFLVLLVLFLFSGCNASYDLVIDDGIFKENLKVSNVHVDSVDRLILPIYYDIDEYDKKKVKPGDDGFYDARYDVNSYSLFHNFDYKDYGNSTLLNYCYNKVDSYYEEDIYYISTSGNFKCFDYYDGIDTITVKINTKYKLIASNADFVKGNNYYWNINKNNIDKGIYLELDISKKKKSIFDYLGSVNAFVWLLLLVLIIGVIVFYIGKLVDSKKNKI